MEHVVRALKKKKKKALLGFEPRISCLLDRRFNQLSHSAPWDLHEGKLNHVLSYIYYISTDTYMVQMYLYYII